MRMRRGGAGGERHCPTECGNRFFGAPLHHGGVTQSRVAPGIAVVECNGALSVLAANRHTHAFVHPSHVGGKPESKAQKGLSRRKIRAPFDGPLQALDGPVVVRFREAPELALGASNELPSTEISRREKRDPPPFGS